MLRSRSVSAEPWHARGTKNELEAFLPVRSRENSILAETQTQIPSLLGELVKRYQVCWEVWPEYLIVDGKEKQIGFELELSGTPELGTEHVGPGCPACRQVYQSLNTIASWILPKDDRPSIYEIGPFQQALRYSSVRAMRPDVTLSVMILHRQRFDQPVDECQVRCLDDMQKKLRVIGACQRQWTLRNAG